MTPLVATDRFVERYPALSQDGRWLLAVSAQTLWALDLEPLAAGGEPKVHLLDEGGGYGGDIGTYAQGLVVQRSCKGTPFEPLTAMPLFVDFQSRKLSWLTAFAEPPAGEYELKGRTRVGNRLFWTE